VGICRNCGEDFPSSVVIDGKRKILSSRKFCIKCSPIGNHNTKKILDSGNILKCSRCNKEYIYSRKNGNSKTLCASCKVYIRRDVIKKKAIEFLGGKCVRCGYDSYIQALVFHHKDRSKKNFSISGRGNKCWESIKEEVSMCELLCVRCHIEVHVDI
jgi:hypothetical protein